MYCIIIIITFSVLLLFAKDNNNHAVVEFCSIYGLQKLIKIN